MIKAGDTVGADLATRAGAAVTGATVSGGLVGRVNELELEHYQLHHCDGVRSANPGVECVLQKTYIQAPRGAGT